MTGWDRYLLGLAGALLLPAAHAYAQQQSASVAAGPGLQAVQAGPALRVAQARAPAAAATKGAAEAGDAARGGDPLLRQRVDQLEEQFLDLQVVVGTLESLARNAGAAAPSMRSAPIGSGSGADSARIDALETQVRALTAQLEQLSTHLRSRGGGEAAPIEREALPPVAAPSLALAPAPESGFGATVVTPGGGGDPIGRIISEGAPAGSSSQLALAPYGNGGDPKQAYEAAYGYLLQQNYGAAESAFEDFLRRYPEDSLAGNAQYWLGESLFVRGQYKAAASAFLKGYQTYGRSAKAPDSLLKLAMSLDRLGQKDAACSSFAELSSRFPTAPPHVKTRAQTERQRVGC